MQLFQFKLNKQGKKWLGTVKLHLFEKLANKNYTADLSLWEVDIYFDELINLCQAYEVYDQGAEKGHFTSRYQRSLYNVDRLTARPWWTSKEAKYEDATKVWLKKKVWLE